MGSWGSNRSGVGDYTTQKYNDRVARYAREDREKRTVYLKQFESMTRKEGVFRDFPKFQFRVLKFGRGLKVEMGAGAEGYTCQEIYEKIHPDDFTEITAWANALTVESLRDLKAGFKALLQPKAYQAPEASPQENGP